VKKINPHIERAETLSSEFYISQDIYDATIEKVFAKSWQYVADREQLLSMPENTFPITLLDKAISEPLILHTIVCGYHGRRFDMEGRVEHMPEFKEVENFPRSCDHLHHLDVARWKRFVFTGIDPKIDFEKISSKLDERIGYGKSGDEGFDIPEGHPDYGKVVAAYYYWLFPNFMLNVYPWGVQINVVKPISHQYCKVEFLYYIADEEKWQKFGKDALAEKVEREDEFVVENVQKGMHSRFYDTGQYSVRREKGVHHFHRLISEYFGAE